MCRSWIPYLRETLNSVSSSSLTLFCITVMRIITLRTGTFSGISPALASRNFPTELRARGRGTFDYSQLKKLLSRIDLGFPLPQSSELVKVDFFGGSNESERDSFEFLRCILIVLGITV